MKKNSKILILGLGLSLAFAPINSLVSSNINIAYAEQAVDENEEKELSPEEVIKKANDFLESDAFKALSEDDKKSYKELIKDLNTEYSEDRKDDILNSIKNIELSHIKKQYEDLKEEVLKLKADSLSDDLKKELEAYKDSYETYKDYETQIKNLNTTKLKIENYNKKLEEFKKILKEGLDKNKNSGLDLKAEKEVLENEKSKLDGIENAIISLNKKVLKDGLDKYKNSGLDLKAEEAIYNKKDVSYDEVNNAINSLNKKVEEENRLKNLSKLEDIIDEEESVKNSYLYKKAGKELKEKFDASLENAKSAYKKLENKEEVNNVDALVNSYNLAYKNLDGNKFVDEHSKLVEYFEKNKDKLSGEDQERFAKLINELPDKEDSNLESIERLKAEIKKAIEENQNKGNLKKVSRQVAVKKQPATKKSRSFVRTGVKSVGIVLVVLILAAIAYFFVSKKSKNNK